MKLSELKKHRFKATVTLKAKYPAKEDIPRIRKELEKLAKEHNLTLIENESVFEFKENGQMFFKPKIERQRAGEIYFRPSGDYMFMWDGLTSYGPKINAKMINGNLLEIENMVYEIGEKID